MKRSCKFGVFVIGMCAAILIAGCSSYYMVTDPASGKTYYTEEVDSITGGAVKMKDARTGSVVTLQNSEVKEIDAEEYEAGLTAPESQQMPTEDSDADLTTAPEPDAEPASDTSDKE